MNVGNLDITATDQSVTLRMRHVVQGHPGCVLSFREVYDLVGHLETIVLRNAKQPAAPDDDDLLLGPAPATEDEDLIG